MICHVANGNYGAFISCGDEIYDYAAGLIIAQEAGAIISDWNGKNFSSSFPYLLISNTRLHKELTELLRLT